MKKNILLLFLILLLFKGNAQSNLSLYGYIKDLGMYYQPVDPIQVSSTRTVDFLAFNQIHNRLNFRWYISNELTFATEARNRVFMGQMIKEFPDYVNIIDIDNGYFDLSHIMISSNSWFMHSMLDRVWLDYTKGDWQIRVGRQRINWGVNLVWNPNDIFNSFSYFDFDYEERPGTDAIKIQYYTGVTSSAQLIYKPAREKEHSAVAAMYRFSKFLYDFQFLGARTGMDYVIGGGWAGDIKGGGFRGEFSYFIPHDKDNGSQEAFVASVSGDYTTKNSLYIHGALLFNSHGLTGNAGGREFFDQNLSAKTLSLAKYNLFGQVSYPVSPLITGGLSAIVNPSDASSYLGPSVNWSLGDNLELMVNGQLFFGKSGTEYGDFGKAIFARLKWAF